jgi:hypothetical protein
MKFFKSVKKERFNVGRVTLTKRTLKGKTARVCSLPQTPTAGIAL